MRTESGGNGPCKESGSDGFACEHLEPPFIGVESRDLDLVADHDFLWPAAAQPVSNAAVRAVCSNHQPARRGARDALVLVMHPPSFSIDRQQSSRCGGKLEFAASFDGLLDNALIEPVPAHGAGSRLTGHTNRHGRLMWAMDGGPVDLLEHGVFEANLCHRPWIDQPRTLEGSANGGVLFHQEHIDPAFSKNGGQAGPNRACSDDDDVVVHERKPRDVPHEACASFLLCKPVTDLLGLVQVEDGGKRVPLL